MKEEVRFFRTHGPAWAVKVLYDILADQVLKRFLNRLRFIHQEDLEHDTHQGVTSANEGGLACHLVFGVRIYPKVILQICQDLLRTQSYLNRYVLNTSRYYLRFNGGLLLVI